MRQRHVFFKYELKTSCVAPPILLENSLNAIENKIGQEFKICQKICMTQLFNISVPDHLVKCEKRIAA